MDSEKGIDFIIGGDIAPLGSALQQAEAKVDAAGAKVDEFNKKVEQGAKTGATAIDGLTTAVTHTEGKAVEASGGFTKLGDDAQTAGKSGGAAMGGLATETEGASSAVATLSEAVKGLGALIATLGLGAAFHGLSADLLECVQTFGTFEQTLNQVRAVTGANAEDMGKLRNEAILMGQVTQYSANEAAQGMARMAKDGFDAGQIIQALPPVLSLAAASNSSVDETARIAAGSLRAFGMEASQMGQVADVMAKAVNASGMSLSNMGEAIKVMGPLAHATGQSFTDMSTELALLGKNMLLGGSAGNGLQAILTRLASPPKDCATALQQLKISITDTTGSMLPLNMIIDQLRDKTADMSDKQRAATLEHISGRYALKDLLDLVNAAPDAYDKMNLKLSESGASANIAKTMMEGYLGSVKLATSSIETMEKVLGEQLAPAATLVANTIQHAADAVSGLSPTMLAFIGSVGVAITAFTGLSLGAAGVAIAYGLVSAAASASAKEVATAAAAQAAAAVTAAEETAAAATAATAVLVAESQTGVASMAATEAAFLADAAAFSAALTVETTAAAAASATAAAAGGAALVAFVVAVAPVAITLGAVAAALGVVTYELAQNKIAHEKAQAALAAENAGRIQAIQTTRDHREELENLIASHDELASKTNRTSAENQKLQMIILKLKQDFPELATAVDQAGDAHWAANSAVNAHTGALKAAGDQAYRNIVAEEKLASVMLHMAGMKAQSAHQGVADARAKSLVAPYLGDDADGNIVAAKAAAREADQNYINMGKWHQDAGQRSQAAGAGRDPLNDPAVADHYQKQPTPGAAFTGGGGRHPRGRGHHPRAGGGAGKANAAAATDEIDTKAEAEAEAKLAEATDARILAADKALLAEQITLLGIKKDAGVLSEEQYIQQVHDVKAKEIDVDAEAQRAKLTGQVVALNTELAAEELAASKSTGNAKKKEETKAQVTRDTLLKLGEQIEGIEQGRIAKHTALDLETQRQEEAAAQKRIALAMEVANQSQKMEQDTANIKAETAALGMGYYEKLAATATLTFDKERQAAKTAYDAEMAGLAAKKAQGADVDKAQQDALDQYNAKLALVFTKEEQAADAIRKDWVGAVKELNTTFDGLVNSPSLAKFTDLANHIAEHPEKLSQWSGAIEQATKNLSDMGETLQAVSDGASITEAGIGSVAAGVGTLATGFGALVLAGAGIKDMFDKQTAAANQLTAAIDSVNLATAKTRANTESDPRKKADQEFEVAKQEALAKLTKANETTEKLQDEKNAGFHFGQVDNTDYFDSRSANAKQYLADLADAQKKHDDAIGAANQADLKPELAADKAAAKLDTKQDNASAAIIKKDDTQELGRYNSGVEKLVTLQKDLNAGHDRYGNQVTLLAQAADQAAAKQAEADRAHEKYLDEAAKIKAEIALIDKNEALDVIKVEDQNIAIRAKTEYQTKTEEIKKITDKASADRTAKQQQLDELTQTDQLNQTTFQNDIQRIQNEAKEKTAANIKEQGEILANVAVAQQRLGIERSITAEIARRSSGGYAATSNPNGGYNFDGGSGGSGGSSTESAATSLAMQTFAGWGGSMYADGADKGPVPADGPAYLHKGEIVVNSPQQSRLLAYLTGPMPIPSSADLMAVARSSGSGGSGSVSIDTITINLQKGDAAEVARNVRQELDKQFGDLVRKLGGSRI